jgi:predicted lipoprotein
MRPFAVTSSLCAALAVSVAAFVACEEEGSPPTDYAPMLRSVSTKSIVPANDTFGTQADALATAAAAFQSTPDADTLGTLQAAWRSARRSWRALDAFHFGPVADLAIGERIDASPANAQEIDRLLAATDAIDIAKVPAAAKGFLGLEHLIFSQNALTRFQGANGERARTFIKAFADEIATSAHQLADAWAAGKGGYTTQLETAGAGSSRYPTQRAAVDDLVAGAGYALELVVGVRLARPLGRTTGGTPDPSLDPTLASDSAVADMNDTLSGVRSVYQNDGFSSRIRAKAQALDDRVNTELADCAAKVTAIPKPFGDTVRSSTAVVTAAYESCKTLKGTWNTDLTSAIGATLKPADTDGD